MISVFTIIDVVLTSQPHYSSHYFWANSRPEIRVVNSDFVIMEVIQYIIYLGCGAGKVENSDFVYTVFLGTGDFVMRYLPAGGRSGEQ